MAYTSDWTVGIWPARSSGAKYSGVPLIESSPAATCWVKPCCVMRRAGGSNLAGDQMVHPFICSARDGMQDLGDQAGCGHADWINDSGEVVGLTEDANHARRAFYRTEDKMTPLGTIGTDRDSKATSINSRGVVVGVAGVFGQADLHGFIWKHSGPLVALDDLVIGSTVVKVVAATEINELGEIAGTGRLPNGELHAVVLVPGDH